jgi:hypothetical protein
MGVRGARLLGGSQGASAGRPDALASLAVALGDFGRRNRAVVEVGLNPVDSGGNETVAVDALVVHSAG